MIELVMIFALGVLVASLLFLLVLPVLSRRAIRLVTRRLQRLVPLSMTEIMAERDQIRAEHAAAARRLEQKLETANRQRADLMVQNGRQATHNLKLDQSLADANGRIAVLDAELRRATADAREAQATLGTQMQLLHDTLGLAERRHDLLRATEAELATTEVVADERRATIAGLETRSTGQDLRIRIALAQATKAGEDLARAKSTIETLNAERDIVRAEAALLTEEQEALLAQVAGERLKAARGEHRAAELADKIATHVAKLSEQAGDIAALQRFLTAANGKRDALQVERDRLVQEVERAARALAEAQRAHVAPPQPATVVDTEFDVLRDAIAFVAAELLRVGDKGAARASKAGASEDPEQAVLPFVATAPRQDAAKVQ